MAIGARYFTPGVAHKIFGKGKSVNRGKCYQLSHAESIEIF